MFTTVLSLEVYFWNYTQIITYVVSMGKYFSYFTGNCYKYNLSTIIEVIEDFHLRKSGYYILVSITYNMNWWQKTLLTAS